MSAALIKPVTIEWVRVNLDLPGHPKSRLLAELIQEAKAYAYAQEVWMWCANHARSGRIEKKWQPVLERSVGWTKEPGGLWAAMVEAEFMSWDGDVLCVHDWEEHQGQAIAQTVKETETKRLKRAQEAEARRLQKEAEEAPRKGNGGAAAAPRNSRGNGPGTLDGDGDGDGDKKLLKPPNPLPGGRVASGQPASPAVEAHAKGPALVDKLADVFRDVHGQRWQPHRKHDEDFVLPALGKAEGNEDEVVRRWRIAQRARFPKCRSVRDLVDNWNSYAVEEVASGPPVSNPGRGGDDGQRPPCAFPGCRKASDGELFAVGLCNRHIGEGDLAIGSKRSNPEVKAWLRQSARKAGVA